MTSSARWLTSWLSVVCGGAPSSPCPTCLTTACVWPSPASGGKPNPSARWLAVGVFVAAWIGQFIGHQFEGRRPSFLTDLAYLLIGPAWLMAKLLRRLGMENLA